MHDSLPPLNDALRDKYRRLQESLAQHNSLLVAFSGGVDSTFLLQVAHDVLGTKVRAITAISPSFPASERETAQRLARRIGTQQLEVETFEHEEEGYIANEPNRCYFCKTELFVACQRKAEELGTQAIAFGAIADDAGDHRPGMQAAAEMKILAPLLEVDLSKVEIRTLSYALELETWDKPSLACLASRIPFGTEVTVDRLRRVELAEEALKSMGLRELRVRDHHPVARLELSADAFDQLQDPDFREAVQSACTGAGFTFVALDLRPFRSGSMTRAQLLG